MSHPDLAHVLHHANHQVNQIAEMLLETGRASPVGSLVDPVSQIASHLKPEHRRMGVGFALGALAVLVVRNVVRKRANANESALHSH